MSVENLCPHCGKPVPANTLGGICPECMLKAGLLQTEAGDGPAGKKGISLPTPEEIAPLFPQLELLEFLGRGGMGAVYKARQPKLGRFVALKVLARERETDPKFAERFTREAQALARLNHPNIVTVYDFGEVAGLCYLLMEFVDGKNLRELLQSQKLSPNQALTIVPKLCEALQFAHEQGVVHRDVKPENILLDKQGRVKIADFGIAKMVGGGGGRTNLTDEKQVMGTPHYMAPEQVEKPQEVDHRADIYSLGVVFYEMLTGELPIGKFQPPSRKVQVDVRLDEVVLHALEKEPERRYQHASEVGMDVEAIATTLAKPVSDGRTASSREKPDKIRLAAAICFVAALMLCGIWFVMHLVNQKERSPPPLSGLVSWWQAEGNASDAIGKNDGSFLGSPSYANGKVGQAFDFDGASYVLVPDSDSLHFTNVMTVQCWINMRTFAGVNVAREIVSKCAAANLEQNSFSLGIDPPTRQAHINLVSSDYASSIQVRSTVAAIGTNEWIHLAATCDGSSLNLYVNGVLSGTTPWTKGVFPGDQPMTIGCTMQEAPTAFFNGRIDEVSLYNRALGPSEIAAIYNSGRAGKRLSDKVSDQGPVSR